MAYLICPLVEANGTKVTETLRTLSARAAPTDGCSSGPGVTGGAANIKVVKCHVSLDPKLCYRPLFQ